MNWIIFCTSFLSIVCVAIGHFNIGRSCDVLCTETRRCQIDVKKNIRRRDAFDEQTMKFRDKQRSDPSILKIWGQTIKQMKWMNGMISKDIEIPGEQYTFLAHIRKLEGILWKCYEIVFHRSGILVLCFLFCSTQYSKSVSILSIKLRERTEKKYISFTVCSSDRANNTEEDIAQPIQNSDNIFLNRCSFFLLLSVVVPKKYSGEQWRYLWRIYECQSHEARKKKCVYSVYIGQCNVEMYTCVSYVWRSARAPKHWTFVARANIEFVSYSVDFIFIYCWIQQTFKQTISVLCG